MCAPGDAHQNSDRETAEAPYHGLDVFARSNGASVRKVCVGRSSTARVYATGRRLALWLCHVRRTVTISLRCGRDFESTERRREGTPHSNVHRHMVIGNPWRRIIRIPDPTATMNIPCFCLVLG